MEAPRVTKLQFSGKIIHITQQSEANEAIRLLRKDATRSDVVEDAYKAYVGFDMEWQPEQASGQVSPIALIQVASERICLIFYMLKLRTMPKALKDLFLDEWVLKVGCHVGQDLKKLKSQYFITPKGILDVARMARHLHFKRLGLHALVLELLGHHLPKGKARSDLGSRELRPDQLTCVTTDPYATLLVYNELEAIEDEEGVEPYWSILLGEEAAAVKQQQQQQQQPQVKPQAQAQAQQQAQPQSRSPRQDQQQQQHQKQQQDYQARIEELEGLVAALARPHADMLARLTAIENESCLVRATFEQRIAVLEAENRRLAYELAQSARQFTPTAPLPVQHHLAVPVQQLQATFHSQQQPPLSPHRQQQQQPQHQQPQSRSPRQDQQQQPQRAVKESLPQDQQQQGQQRGRSQGARRNNQQQQREQLPAEHKQATTAPATNQGGPAERTVEKPRAKGRRRDEQQTTRHNPHYDNESPNAATPQQQQQQPQEQQQQRSQARQAKPRSTEEQQPQQQQQQQTGARQGDRPRKQRPRNNAAPRTQGSGEGQAPQQPAVDQQQQQQQQQSGGERQQQPRQQPKQRPEDEQPRQQPQQQQQQQRPQQQQAAAKVEPSSNPEQWADMAAAEALPQRVPQQKRRGKPYSAQRREASSAPSSPKPSKPAAEPPRSASP